MALFLGWGGENFANFRASACVYQGFLVPLWRKFKNTQ